MNSEVMVEEFADGETRVGAAAEGGPRRHRIAGSALAGRCGQGTTPREWETRRVP